MEKVTNRDVYRRERTNKFKAYILVGIRMLHVMPEEDGIIFKKTILSRE